MLSGLRKSVLRSIPIALVLALSAAALAQTPVAEDRVNFWYAETEIMETGPGGDYAVMTIERETLSYSAYESRWRERVENYWLPIYMGLLNDDPLAAEDAGISQERGDAMIAMDEQTRQRAGENPIYAEEIARRMADWTVYYEQLERWNIYVAEALDKTNTVELTRDGMTVREQRIEDEDLIISYDPSLVDSELDRVQTNFERAAGEKLEAQERVYDSMVNRIRENIASNESFYDWLAMREAAVVDFAEKWGRQYDGTQFTVDDTLFLVRNVSERPAAGEEDTLREYLPRNGMVLDVPKGKMVTPFDLIEEDGSVKRPAR